jgi:5-methylcytosine-specific restriction enzyme subunit McrC
VKKEVHLREFERSADIELTPEQYNSICNFSDLISVQGGRRFGTYHLEANSWIGHILLPQMKIVIEPKIGAVDVLKMIIGGDGEANPKDFDAIVKSDSTLWDIIAEGLMYETLRILRQGLRHKFIEQVDSLMTPRGKVEFYSDFIANTPIRKGVVCEHDEFSPSIPENVAIKWALEVLEQLVSKEKVGRLRQVVSRMDAIIHSPVMPHFAMPSSNDVYFRALWLVRLIDRTTALNLNRYGFRSAGFGVDMNKVFEGYVRNQLRIAARPGLLRITEKSLAKRDLCSQVKLEPDILITRAGKPVVVADCKYKIDWSKINSDIYQILAYLEGYQPINTAVILCPASAEFNEKVIDLPRGRTLLVLSLPVDKLFAPQFWTDLVLRLEHSLNSSGIASQAG